MTNQHTFETRGRRRWVIATAVALAMAAVGDAGPEIIGSGSFVAGYDGPGPLIYLAFAAIVLTVQWRFAPLLAVAMSAFFIVGGLADAEFTGRLATPAGVASVARQVPSPPTVTRT